MKSRGWSRAAGLIAPPFTSTRRTRDDRRTAVDRPAAAVHDPPQHRRRDAEPERLAGQLDDRVAAASRPRGALVDLDDGERPRRARRPGRGGRPVRARHDATSSPRAIARRRRTTRSGPARRSTPAQPDRREGHRSPPRSRFGRGAPASSGPSRPVAGGHVAPAPRPAGRRASAPAPQPVLPRGAAPRGRGRRERCVEGGAPRERARGARPGRPGPPRSRANWTSGGRPASTGSKACCWRNVSRSSRATSSSDAVGVGQGVRADERDDVEERSLARQELDRLGRARSAQSASTVVVVPGRQRRRRRASRTAVQPIAGKWRAWARSVSSAQNVPARRRLAWVTGSLKSPPGGETAADEGDRARPRSGAPIATAAPGALVEGGQPAAEVGRDSPPRPAAPRAAR